MTAEQVLEKMVRNLHDILWEKARTSFEKSALYVDKHDTQHGQMLQCFYAFCKKHSGRCTTHYAVVKHLGLRPFKRMRHFTGVQPSGITESAIPDVNEFR